MEADPLTKQELAIKNQVEFWFSDSNLPRDKFLRGICDGNDGWVPLEVLMTFQRMKSLTTDPAAVVKACQGSTELEFNEDSTKIKRTRPLPEKDNYHERCVYVKGLPVAEDKPVTIEDVQDFFGKLGKVNSVRLQRSQNKFNGNVLVEFESPEVAKKVLETPEIEWLTGEKLLTKIFTPMQRELKPKTENKRPVITHSTPSLTYEPGLIIRIQNVPATPREEIKDFFSHYGKVLHVDQGSDVKIRFKDSGAAQEALKAITDETAVFKETVLKGELLPEEEDKLYWEQNVLPHKRRVDRGGPWKKARK